MGPHGSHTGCCVAIFLAGEAHTIVLTHVVVKSFIVSCQNGHNGQKLAGSA